MKALCENCKETFDTTDGKYEYHIHSECTLTDEDRRYNRVGALSAVLFMFSVIITIISVFELFPIFGVWAIPLGALCGAPVFTVSQLVMIEKIKVFR